ncbi:MAG: PAS domain-containing protein [Friedmanniella sp.]
MLDVRPDAAPERAALRQVRPTGEERTFSPEELIVSKTDPRGVINYVNDVFLRVSGYSRSELIGKPHSIVRHPEMPRAVFQLVWETLAGKREIFAYVDNLAADGASYWALAHITPSYGYDGAVDGYHANLRAPDRGVVAVIRPLYRRLQEEERRHADPAAAVAASTALLHQLIAERASSYEAFIWSLIGSRAV